LHAVIVHLKYTDYHEQKLKEKEEKKKVKKQREDEKKQGKIEINQTSNNETKSTVESHEIKDTEKDREQGKIEIKQTSNNETKSTVESHEIKVLRGLCVVALQFKTDSAEERKKELENLTEAIKDFNGDREKKEVKGKKKGGL